MLEVGCGWGSFAIRAAQRTGCRVTGARGCGGRCAPVLPVRAPQGDAGCCRAGSSRR